MWGGQVPLIHGEEHVKCRAAQPVAAHWRPVGRQPVCPSLASLCIAASHAQRAAPAVHAEPLQVRSKASAEEVDGWIASNDLVAVLDGAQGVLRMLGRCLLVAGAKSYTHMASVLGSA